MTWGQKFFSFQGRMRRRDFWICNLILLAFCIVLNIVLGLMMGGAAVAPMAIDPADPAAATASLAALGALSATSMIIFLVVLWPSLAIATKRHHDRNQSGWFNLILFVPLIGLFWALINLGLLDGTPGPNQYGPSPKGLEGEAAAAA